jgi:hypothetical protein
VERLLTAVIPAKSDGFRELLTREVSKTREVSQKLTPVAPLFIDFHLGLSAKQEQQIVLFLKTLTDGYVEEEEKRALCAGAVHFLRKPFSKEALLRAIHMVFKPSANNVSKNL